MIKISEIKFNAIAGYARSPQARIDAEEVAYYELGTQPILGMVIMDRVDKDFCGLVFAPDRRLRYRFVNMTEFTSRRRAEVALRRSMEKANHAPAEDHHQGDEDGDPVDFFKVHGPHLVLHPDFKILMESHGYLAARRIIEPMMRWYEDADGNFIEQFQTTGFDQRMWELYLFAAFTEMEYVIDRRSAVPDFSLIGPFGEVAVEAVTVAASRSGKLANPPDLNTESGRKDFLENYMPIKFGSPLYSKLCKRYWEKPSVSGKALVFAIEDFSSVGSMAFTRSALPTYLYGAAYDWHRDESGELIITPRKIKEHRWGEKVIPSGFFNQPDAEHCSAILFSNSGTIAKFNRMGVLAGFCPEDVILVRQGTRPDPDPQATDPIPFRVIVNAPGYGEAWSEGLEVFHNPNALIPLSPYAMPDATHHILQADGLISSQSMRLDPLASQTFIFTPMNLETAMSSFGSH